MERRKRLVGGALVFGLLVLAPVCWGQDFPVTYFPGEAPFVPLVRKALEAAGLRPTFAEQPLARALTSVGTGAASGSFFRTQAAIDQTPDVRKVDVPLYRISYVAVTLKPGLVVHGREDLKALTVGYPLGNVALTGFVAGLPQVVTAPDTVGVLKMLRAERFDVALCAEPTLGSFAKEAHLSGYTVQQPPVVTELLYFVVHKSQAALVPVLEQAFRNLVDSGQWKRELDLGASGLAK